MCLFSLFYMLQQRNPIAIYLLILISFSMNKDIIILYDIYIRYIFIWKRLNFLSFYLVTENLNFLTISFLFHLITLYTLIPESSWRFFFYKVNSSLQPNSSNTNNFILQIRPVIDKVFPFEATPDAYAHVIHGHARGKTVISVQ